MTLTLTRASRTLTQTRTPALIYIRYFCYRCYQITLGKYMYSQNIHESKALVSTHKSCLVKSSVKKTVVVLKLDRDATAAATYETHQLKSEGWGRQNTTHNPNISPNLNNGHVSNNKLLCMCIGGGQKVDKSFFFVGQIENHFFLF